MKNTLLKFAAQTACRFPVSVVRLLAGKPVVIDGQQLDPLIQMMVKRFGDPPGQIGTVASTREGYETKGDWLTHPPHPDVIIALHTFDGPNGRIPCEIHRPKALAQKDAPVLIFYHGGGHVGGSLTSHRDVCRQLAYEANMAVVAVDYRLAPEHKFPVGINDCLAAFDTVARDAASLGFDAGRIAVGGDSAGGNAAAIVAQQRRYSEVSPKYQLLWVPWLDMSKQSRSYDLFGHGYYLEKAKMEWFTDHYLHDPSQALDPLVSPLLGDVSGVCPAGVLVAGFDPLRDEGRAYANKLTEAGIPTELHVFEDLVHIFINIGGHVPAARRAFDQAVSMLRANV
ncbi:alpha/beta hydrolase [Tateyamaria omphalii]|uniref:alpha/beta hydrolase n=1 Tax=Tateyamaria omphalii TaxID=299262 RepID=UPI001678E5E0|nr:alpha/beta hydrolase [Tateyamaria omphalii]GGX51292.1 alpha/beta hydrolase [Tateyamaria omphalii]